MPTSPHYGQVTKLAAPGAQLGTFHKRMSRRRSPPPGRVTCGGSPGFACQVPAGRLQPVQLPVADPAVEPGLRLAWRPVGNDAIEQPVSGRGIRTEVPVKGGTSRPLVEDAQLLAGRRGNLHYREMVRNRT